jgi:hypothetical protein
MHENASSKRRELALKRMVSLPLSGGCTSQKVITVFRESVVHRGQGRTIALPPQGNSATFGLTRGRIFVGPP